MRERGEGLFPFPRPDWSNSSPSVEMRVQQNSVGITLNQLKYIAIAAMTLDHIAFAFVPNSSILYDLMRFIGRLAAPIMFFSAAEGCRHTQNMNRYMLRLAIFALISWIPYLFFYYGGDLTSGSPIRPNVIVTIFLGVAAVRVQRSNKIQSMGVKTMLITGLVLLSVPADWGVIGVLIILTMDRFRVSFSIQMFALSILLLFGLDITELATQPILSLAHYGRLSLDQGIWITAVINAGALLSIDLFSYYKGQHGRKNWASKWLFYFYYPAHLMILGLLQSIF